MTLRYKTPEEEIRITKKYIIVNIFIAITLFCILIWGIWLNYNTDFGEYQLIFHLVLPIPLIGMAWTIYHIRSTYLFIEEIE